jgi:hypothetical protein
MGRRWTVLIYTRHGVWLHTERFGIPQRYFFTKSGAYRYAAFIEESQHLRAEVALRD